VRELRDILDAFQTLRKSGEAGVLASAVRTEGSTYRRSGARMLALPDDRMIGLISGGCLEGDLLEHARSVRESGEPRIVRYDMRPEEDIIWGLGLGCAGVVDVLLERVDAEAPGPLDLLAECIRERKPGAIATALAGKAPLATRWTLHPDGRFSGPADGAAQIERATRQAQERERDALLAGEAGEILIEVVRPPPRLLVFGAGPDAVPVVRIAYELGWEVVVVDWRPAYARPESFREASAVVLCEAERVGEQVDVDGTSAALVMTHHYLHDRSLLRFLLPSAVRFIGMLGPRTRMESLLGDLREEGLSLTREQLERVHGPAGLDIGAESPEQIALALVAEIHAVLAGRSGGWLCEREGPIHDDQGA
jgi:xanthine/CO dehydrogenase XdhC/CoxF family maturation factor